MKFTLCMFTFFIGFLGFAQETTSNYAVKKVAVSDTIVIDSVSINSSKFILKKKDETIIDSTLYSVDFAKALLTFKVPIEEDSITIEYLRYPDFLTKKYFQLDKNTGEELPGGGIVQD